MKNEIESMFKNLYDEEVRSGEVHDPLYNVIVDGFLRAIFSIIGYHFYWALRIIGVFEYKKSFESNTVFYDKNSNSWCENIVENGVPMTVQVDLDQEFSKVLAGAMYRSVKPFVRQENKNIGVLQVFPNKEIALVTTKYVYSVMDKFYLGLYMYLVITIGG